MKKIFSITFFVFITVTALQAQMNTQTLNINTEASIDSAGNAVFNVSGKLTAQQWIAWNYMYGGGNAFNVKRSIERSLSPYYLYDFKYTPNEMDRSFSIQYKAKGVIEYLGNDKWIASIGLKDVEPMKLTDNTFSCVASQLGNSNIIQNNMKVTLPAAAGSMEFDKDEFNMVQVKYKMPTENIETTGNDKMKTIGYTLMGLGILSFLPIVAFRKKIA
ncbi:MAG TPA: hypothetical protein VFW07_14320 [Parafilimonas sp.]|nr:hypothetical protein [Parafilimonas sp.]